MTIEIRKFDDLHRFIESNRAKVMVYRGHRSLDYKLLPKAWRKTKSSRRKLLRKETECLLSFKNKAVPYLDFMPTNDWEWLAIAQHYGLGTRLMDWSHNPLAAAYFAVEKPHDSDSVIYALESKKMINTLEFDDPFSVDTVGRFIPRHVTTRITAQSGLFTIHPEPKKEFEDENLQKLIIKRSFRKNFKGMLYKYGIHRFSLFPDMDGLSSHIEWFQNESH